MKIFDKKTILITGGTGSFGNAFLNRVINSDALEIKIFSRDEKKQDDMRKHYSNEKLKFIIGDVRDKDALLDATHTQALTAELPLPPLNACLLRGALARIDISGGPTRT